MRICKGAKPISTIQFMSYLNESIDELIAYKLIISASTSRAAAGCSMRVHYPSTREQSAAFRAWPSVLKMFLLDVSNDASFAYFVTAVTPQAREPWSVISSVNGL